MADTRIALPGRLRKVGKGQSKDPNQWKVLGLCKARSVG